MKYPRSFQFAALAALCMGATAWGEDSVRMPPAAGDGASAPKTVPVVPGATAPAGAAAAGASIKAAPVRIGHSAHRVATFLDPVEADGVANADQIMLLANKMFDVIVNFGVGYDSNPVLEANGEGEWVYWTDMRILLNPETIGNPARGFYYGVDIGSGIFSYSNNERSLAGGRDQGELDARVFTGVRGAKTDVRFDAGYRMNNGNLLDFSHLDREARRTDSDDLDLRVSGVRKLDHSQIHGGVMWFERDFNSDSALNDQTGLVADGGWLFAPAFAPKTQMGAGVRMGSYDTDRNFRQEFSEPSFRFNYQLSPKTALSGRVGYTFIDYNGAGAIPDNGFTSYGVGVRWVPTAKTSFDLNAYRDFMPALVYANQDYFRHGVAFGISQLLPFNWSFRSAVAFETADYFATAADVVTDREDEYWRIGGDFSHPLNLFGTLGGQFSAFYYHNANDSSEDVATFDETFAGMKIGVSY